MATRTACIVIGHKSGHSIPLGAVGFHVKSGFDKKGGSSFPIYTTSSGSKAITGGNVYPEDVIWADGEEVKGNDGLKQAIDTLKERVAVLQHVYDTGEAPIPKDVQEKAENILNTVKAVQANDDAKALQFLIECLK